MPNRFFAISLYRIPIQIVFSTIFALLVTFCDNPSSGNTPTSGTPSTTSTSSTITTSTTTTSSTSSSTSQTTTSTPLVSLPPWTGIANVIPITVGGSSLCNAANQPCTNVVICKPGSTTQCAVLHDILVDTGSTGLRVF